MAIQKIAVSTNKGGVGKTTVTKCLATAAAAAGFTVLVLDMDTQQNATNWGRRRLSKHPRMLLPLARFTTENDLPQELRRAEESGCDLVFVDTPPGRSTEAPAAVEACDLVLIPFVNDQDAYDGVVKTAGLARRLGKPAFGVLTFATPNSLVHADTARQVLEAIPLPFAPVVLHRYDAHRLANVSGLTAQESEPESIAAAEIGALWTWLCAVLQIGTNADVQESTDASVHRGVA